MPTKRALGLLTSIGLILGVTACDPTPTNDAIEACAERETIVTLTEPPPNVPVYRPATWPWDGPLLDGSTVNATAMDWNVPAEGYTTPGSAKARYAVQLGVKEGTPVHDDICFIGGSITYGLDHDETPWGEWKRTAQMIIHSSNAQIVGTRLYDMGDGIRFTWPYGQDWAVRGAHIRQAHDDCIENDGQFNGVIEDSFLDGCFVAVSSTAEGPGPDGTGKVVEIKDSLIRLQPMPHVHNPDYWAAPGHAALFKWDKGRRAPDIHMHDSVIVLEQHSAIRVSDGQRRYPLLPFHQPSDGPRQEYLREENCSNNTIVWLGDGDPGFEPPGGIFGDVEVIPDCFTVLTGQAARDFWEQTRDDWLEAHPLAWQPDVHPEVFEYDELAS